ncbi:RDD family protein [Candidatus Poriferisodalis sp.]|uniref:RDD family protein n=1 Tax=Candidatus Poriferisodalis sp. TaxID=3101277 RepID=UPI003B5C33F0
MTDLEGPWRRAHLQDESTRRAATLHDGSTVPLAGNWERLAARSIDFAISTGFLILVGGRLLWSVAKWTDGSLSGPIREWRVIWIPALPLVAAVLYRIASTASWGQTLGKRLLSISVVDASTGRRPRWRQSVLRTAVTSCGGFIALAAFSFWFVLSIVSAGTGEAIFFLVAGLAVSALCYLSATWQSQRQGWHDRAARTLVIKTP